MYIAEQLKLRDEYIALSGKPSKGYTDSFKNFFIYESDPLQSADIEIRQLKDEYLKNIGKKTEGFWLSERGDALYNMKAAARYGDKEAYEKYMHKYFTLGGTERGIRDSMSRIHPLAGLTAEDKEGFVSSLDDNGKEKLRLSLKYFDETFAKSMMMAGQGVRQEGPAPFEQPPSGPQTITPEQKMKRIKDLF